jgi:hypothetical protein
MFVVGACGWQIYQVVENKLPKKKNSIQLKFMRAVIFKLRDSDCNVLRGAEAGLLSDVIGVGGDFIYIGGADGLIVPVHSHTRN